MPDYQGGGPFATDTLLAEVEADGAGTIKRSFGVTSVVRTGVGVYDVTLDFPSAQSQDAVTAGVIAGAPRFATPARTSATVITVVTWDNAGANVDTTFWLRVIRRGQGR